jgi:hypothetical protein
MVVALLVGGCAGESPHTLNRAALRATKPRTLVVLKSPTPQLVAWTPGQGVLIALFGPAGWGLAEATSRASGTSLTKRAELDDPTVAIASRLALALAKRFSLETSYKDGVIRDGYGAPLELTPERLAEAFPGSDLVLDVRTTDWGFHPTSMGDRYGATYDGTVRLVDTRTRAVLAEGICVFHPLDGSDGPTRDQLLAKNADVLKQQLTSITDFCADDYRTRILGLYQ